jgi:hypothetical protein
MKQIGIIVCGLTLSFSAFCQIGESTLIWPAFGAPPDPNAINIVILGDGYADPLLVSTDTFRFVDHSEDLRLRFLSSSPFTEYQDYFNIYRIFVPSDSSSILNPCIGLDLDTLDCPQHFDTTAVTYYESTYSSYVAAIDTNIARSLTCSRPKVNGVLDSWGFDPLITPVFMLANSSYFGGSGAHMLASSCTDAGGLISPNKALHEFAHSFSEVRDEYWTGGSEAFVFDSLNMSNTAILQDVPWKNWVDTSLWYPGIENDTPLDSMFTLPLGVYPHLRQDHLNANLVNGTNQWAYDLDSIIGWFKPTTYYECKMENNDSAFCPVFREAIIERIHQLAPAMYGFSPSNADTLTASETTTFSIDLIQTTNNTVVVEWWLNGDSITTNDGTWNLDCDATEWNIGTNTLTAIVEDRTLFIRIDDHSGHTQSVTWNIEFNGAEADLWMRDNPSDQGNTMPPTSIPWLSYDHGPDLWVRNQLDGSPEHENPSFGQDSVFVYARVFNRGCKTSDPQHQVNTYYTLAGTANAWPENFDGTNGLVGGSIDSLPVGLALATGDSIVLEFEWDLTQVTAAVSDSQGVCLLVMIDSTANDPSTWHSFIGDYVWYNNNMVMHNMVIVDVDSAGFGIVNGNKYPPGSLILVGNPTNSNGVFDLHFDANPTPSGKPLSKEAEIYLVFDDNAWDIGSAIKDTDLSGLKRKDENTFIATADNAVIGNISIPANTRVPLYIGFGFLTKEVEPNLMYSYQVTQWKSGDSGPMGGELYRVLRNQRYLFNADAGDDKEVDKYAQVTVSADDIQEDATYNWYDMGGNLIYTGKDLTVTANITKKYKLEVIAELDGYKDYSEVEVKVKIGEITGISPNPANGQTAVSYHTQGGSSAYLAVFNTITGSSDQYILPLGLGTLNLYLSSYPTGNYEVLLVTDGAVRDTESLMVQ